MKIYQKVTKSSSKYCNTISYFPIGLLSQAYDIYVNSIICTFIISSVSCSIFCIDLCAFLSITWLLIYSYERNYLAMCVLELVS